jgi:cyclase
MGGLCKKKLKKRLIARLDIKNKYLIKGINLEGLRKIGDPNHFANNYYKNNIDEILFIDCVASLYKRNSLIDVIKFVTKNIFVPITVGGGIRSVKDVEKLLNAGSDKITINTFAVEKPIILKEISRIYGSQCLVLSVQAKKIKEGKWEVYTNGGREKTGLDVIDWIKKSIQLGIGEILLTSIDQEGTRNGFDLDLLRSVSRFSTVPIIASGGAGKLEHIKSAFNFADAVAIADMLHYKRFSISKIKKYLKNELS